MWVSFSLVIMTKSDWAASTDAGNMSFQERNFICISEFERTLGKRYTWSNISRPALSYPKLVNTTVNPWEISAIVFLALKSAPMNSETNLLCINVDSLNC